MACRASRKWSKHSQSQAVDVHGHGDDVTLERDSQSKCQTHADARGWVWSPATLPESATSIVFLLLVLESRATCLIHTRSRWEETLRPTTLDKCKSSYTSAWSEGTNQQKAQSMHARNYYFHPVLAGDPYAVTIDHTLTRAKRDNLSATDWTGHSGEYHILVSCIWYYIHSAVVHIIID